MKVARTRGRLSSGCIVLCLPLAAAALLAGAERVAAVSLEGRSWSAVEVYQPPGYGHALPDFLGTTSSGTPYAVPWFERGTFGRDAGRIEWVDSSWVQRWKLNHRTNYLYRMPALGSGPSGLVWNVPDFMPGTESRQLVLSAWDHGSSASVPDTVGHMWAGHFSYGGAVAGSRRWVAFGDYPAPFLKLLYSDTAGFWKHISAPGDGSNGIAMYPVNDTTALLAWGEARTPNGIRWGVVSGSAFNEGPRPPRSDGLSFNPEWIPRRSGGWWLAWVTKQNHIAMALLDGMSWVERIDLTAAYSPPGTHITDGIVDMLDVGMDRPMVGWTASRYGSYEQVYCLSIPSASGFGVGQPLATPTDAFGPHFTVDRNGDVWVVWYTFEFKGMYFMHTYTRAIAGAPVVTGTSDRRTIGWTLSEPGPGSWWAVLRSLGGDVFEEIGRVQAGPDAGLTFLDTSRAAGPLRYRVRRECVDKRYEWLGPIRTWHPRKPGISANPGPIADRIELLVQDVADGEVELRLFDVQGRVVWKTPARPRAGRIEVRLSDAPAPLASGLYFAVVVDGLQRTSEPVRLIVTR